MRLCDCRHLFTNLPTSLRSVRDSFQSYKLINEPTTENRQPTSQRKKNPPGFDGRRSYKTAHSHCQFQISLYIGINIPNLRIGDIHPEGQRIFIRAAKAKSTGLGILSERVWGLLKKYISIYQPVVWLFEGQTGDKYSERIVQAIFFAAREQSKINPLATVHTLRHSFVTH